MKIDRYAKDIFGKLDNMFPNIAPFNPLATTAINSSNSPSTIQNNNSYKEILKNARDDSYYLERKLQPPRFELYKIARKLMIENYKAKNNNNKKPVPDLVTSENADEYMGIYNTTTQDELDYRLKMDLMHTTPEQRYQERKELYYFHELYRDNGEIGCNPTQRHEICVPECRYYNAVGRFEDDELVAEHKEVVELYNKHNAILKIEIRDDNSFCIKQVRKYNSNNT